MTTIKLDWSHNRFRKRFVWTAEVTHDTGRVEIRVAEDADAMHDFLKRDFPGVKPTYTPSGWSRNVSEFEHSRRSSFAIRSQL